MTGDWGEAPHFSTPRKSNAKPPSELSVHKRQILLQPEHVRAEAGSPGVRFFTLPASFPPLSSFQSPFVFSPSPSVFPYISPSPFSLLLFISLLP